MQLLTIDVVHVEFTLPPAIIVGGNFRADNVDGFVRLLEAGFGVRAEPQDGNVILLRRTR